MALGFMGMRDPRFPPRAHVGRVSPKAGCWRHGKGRGALMEMMDMKEETIRHTEWADGITSLSW